MEYFYCFFGGPVDGMKEPSPAGVKYPLITIRGMVQNGLELVAVYEYESTRETSNAIERCFRYQRTCPREEGLDLLSGKWGE